MNQINIATKKFTDAVKIDIGQLPVTDVKIDFNLTDGSNPVIAENKTFSMTIGTVNGELYKTDDDTVSYRYLKFDNSNVADSLAITMKMNGEEILNDTVSLTYQTSGGIDTSALDKKLDAPATPGTVGQVLTKTADGQEWADAPAGGGGEDTTDYLCFTASQANSTVRLNKTGTPQEISLEYSVDKKHWTTYTWNDKIGATITLANIGDSVWWRGDNEAISNNVSSYNNFVMSGSIDASGNIMSLLDKQLKKKTMSQFCFANLFYQCTSLKTAPLLPATTLADGCYKEMFRGCTSLTKAPDLPATTLVVRCYTSMFSGCTSLIKAPELYATTLTDWCCGGMFSANPNIRHIRVNFTSWEGNYSTANWIMPYSKGVFECPSALDCSTRDASHVPAGWTIVRTDSPKSITSPTTASSEATYQVSPNTPSVPVVTVASALTLNASTVDNGSVAYAEIVLDAATGATVTAGTNLTLVDTPTAGKRNICVCRWSGGVCKLYVTIVEDLPQA